jgi:hypothetical protein
MRRTFPRSSQTSSRLFPTPSPHRVRRRTFRPDLERMEERALLSNFIVNTVSDLDRSGGLPAGYESLRQAIEDTNADTTHDVINFNIGGGGHQVITLTSALPQITNSVTIDGTSQPDFSGTPIVEINGNGLVLRGLDLEAPGCTIQGLVINHITGGGDSGDAIFIAAAATDFVIQGNYIGTDVTGSSCVPVGEGIECYASRGRVGGTGTGQGNLISGSTGYGLQVQDVYHVAVQGNFIGTNAAGTAAIPNQQGIQVGGENGGGGGLVIGGTDPSARNIISGNVVGLNGFFAPEAVVIEGNYIGTQVDGSTALPNTEAGIKSFVSSTIGGTASGARNLISGNSGAAGIAYCGRCTIQGNYIGTDVSGKVALPNEYGIIYSDNCTIGGTTPAARNVISGNGDAGIFGGGGNTIAGNFLGTEVTSEVGLGGSYLGAIYSPNNCSVIGNVISTGTGVGIHDPVNCTFKDNKIGTNSDGTDVVGNELGMLLDQGAIGNTIGGTAPGDGNVISGNGHGIEFRGSASPVNLGAVVEGNLIGTRANGTSPLANGTGLYVNGGVTGVTIGGTVSGSGNLIAYNDVGVSLPIINGNTDSFGVSIEGNSIFGNTEIGINLGDYVVNNQYATRPNDPLDADTGPNGLQNYPDLATAIGGSSTSVTGSLNSTPHETFRIEFFANPVPDPSGFGQGQNYLGFVNVTTDSNGNASINATGLAATSPCEWISATATAADGSTSEFSQDVQAANVTTTTTLGSSASPSSFGQALTFTATVSASAGSGTPGGSVEFVDTTTGNTLGTVPLANGVASLSTSSLPVGNQTIMASYSGCGCFLPSSATISVSVVTSIIVINPSTSGALTISGNATISVPGLIAVDSSSSTALTASGNAQLNASVIDVAGAFRQSGTAAFSPAPTTGVSIPDPLAGLATPGVTGLTNYGSESLSGNSSQTLNPGIYSQIKVSGNASLTLNPGIYIIEGGGLTVSGNASISGSGVMIYNAGSSYPVSGGNFGGITMSGNGTFNLSALTTGPYAGVLIFQSRQNTRALSFSGNAMAGTVGTIYAANALLSMSGNAALQNPLVVGTLNLSGNVSLTQVADGSDGADDASGISGTLIAGNLSVYINDPGGLFTTDELARIQDAINAWDALLVPYNVTINEVSDPNLANLVIDIGTTSACGGAESGVLGCYNQLNSEITLIQGWNWYAGVDPTQIGSGQFDFETTVTHEFGHALGLGHSTNLNSPMYESLPPGVANRIVTTQDLNIPDPPDGADPQKARAHRPVGPTAVVSAPASANDRIMVLDAALAEWFAAKGSWTAKNKLFSRMNE